MTTFLLAPQHYESWKEPSARSMPLHPNKFRLADELVEWCDDNDVAVGNVRGTVDIGLYYGFFVWVDIPDHRAVEFQLRFPDATTAEGEAR